MIQSSAALTGGLVVTIIVVLVCVILKAGLAKTIEAAVFAIYITVVVCVTFFPINFDDEVLYWGNVTWYNYIPFKTIVSYFQSGFGITGLTQLVGNILMSVPFGFFVMMWLKKPKLWKLFLFAFGFTITIELGQMLVGFAIGNMYRNVDIDDVILNAAGAFIGFGIYKLLPDKLKEPLIK